ncbi:calmodulin-binding transcription activator 2-like isoform X3 [Silene latifolia]|uniref:calmodulin-binding transcription activator 2-like isoform X3 n=1 Tax=Silene latifolia TaxID=37657 RepID=UPI003D77D67A
MADRGGGSMAAGIRLDLQQLQLEAQHRWLRPAEICEVLRNFQKFQISSEPPNRPPSGSLFLFDRKVLRYFRKDFHNWRKKKDGKTVKEAHEKLKVGSIDVLHCYYAHGEDNECFQRRTYWLLEEEYMHIVFVHYLEVKGNRCGSRGVESMLSGSPTSNSLSSSVSTSYNDAFGGNAGSPSAASTLTSAYEDFESEDNYQAMSKYPSSPNFPHGQDNFENNRSGLLCANFLPTTNEYKRAQLSDPALNYVALSQQENVYDDRNQFTTLDLASWEEVFEQSTRNSGGLPSQPVIHSTLSVGNTGDYDENLSQLLDDGFVINSSSGGSLATHILQQPRLGTVKSEEGLQKVDSFSKWMTKELDGVDDLNFKSSSNLSWQNIDTASDVNDPSIQLENYSMSPSIGQDQLFDIYDFSPSCASMESETKVLITGKFLVSPSEVSKFNWSCMFGEVEVPAEVLGNGVLCCYAPPHKAGRFPFYVTRANRFACSQVREFEFLVECLDVNSRNVSIDVKEKQLLLQLERLLSMRSPVDLDSYHYIRRQPVVNRILLLMEDELCLGVQNHLKENLLYWLLDKVCEDGKGPNILDEEGQGLLHCAAALGYDWIIPPTLAAGVSVNFRDINGWTALHWAASFGREKTIALLITLGAASGALTDPSPEFPLGRTAADLASANKYKGISGFLAEHSLTAHLETLTMSEHNLDGTLESSISKAVQTIREKAATPGDECDWSDLSLKDSLAAVCNATQAAGRIHQVFRMQSFQRKQSNDSSGGGGDSLLSDERLFSILSSKIHKPGNSYEHSAAVQIQKKYRGWKKRREFLIIRERVVKIQAHVRGHQVRKRYKTVVWSVGILEKVILRWRRKGTGLRGFRPDALKEPIETSKPLEDDDYDYLKKGRKQTEERLQKALVRVKSMVQYPEGRAQYRRLLTAVEGFQKNQKQSRSSILSGLETSPIEIEDDMIDVESLFDDDNFMGIAFE